MKQGHAGHAGGCRRDGLCGTIAGLIVLAIVCPASGEGKPPRAGGDPAVALNQSVSIEEMPVRAEAASGLGSSVGTASTDEGRGADGPATGRDDPDPARQTGGDSASGPAGGALRSRTVARRTLADNLADMDGDSRAPWYRTGIGSLSIVLALIIAAAWALRRWVPSARAADTSVLRVIGRTNLTPKHHIALIKLGRRLVTVGVSPDAITLLGEIDDPAEVAALTARTGGGRGRSDAAFDDLLFRENAEFRKHAVREDDEEGERDRLAASRRHEPMTALLNRLRSLQMK